jgi:hypothetical protein
VYFNGFSQSYHWYCCQFALVSYIQLLQC